jgi:hypothetical protein
MGHNISLSVDIREGTKNKTLPSDPYAPKQISQIIPRANVAFINPFHYYRTIALELHPSEAALYRQFRSEV